MAYCGYITKIKEIIKHPNAERLQIVKLFNTQSIVNLDYYKDQRIVYFPEGGTLNEEYAKKCNLIRKKNEDGTYSGGYLDPNKIRITTVKLRGELSDGLILPIETLSDYVDITTLKDGDQIDVLNGILICQKYIPKKSNGRNVGQHSDSQKKNKKEKKEKITYPYFLEHDDTKQLMYNLHQFHEGDLCTISLKMHGTSDRIMNTLEFVKKYPNKLLKLFGQKPIETKEWKIMSGTRRTILKSSSVDGWYGTNDFRKEYEKQIQNNLPKGMTVYGEIVGWVNETTPIMGRCSNKKLGQDFVNKYGPETIFDYNCEIGKSDFYTYRITMTNEDGYVVELNTPQAQIESEKLGLKFVPVFETFTFTTIDDLLERVNKYIDGKDLIGNHIREGIVIRIENRNGFIAFKAKNDSFKILSGIISENMNTDNMTDDIIDEMA